MSGQVYSAEGITVYEPRDGLGFTVSRDEQWLDGLYESIPEAIRAAREWRENGPWIRALLEDARTASRPQGGTDRA